jgi:hypothetical protein
MTAQPVIRNAESGAAPVMRSALFLCATRTGVAVTAAPNFALAGSAIASAHINAPDS